MDRKEEISAAYRSLGKAHSLYDGQMLGNTVTGRWMLKHIWQIIFWENGSAETVNGLRRGAND